MVMIGDSHLCRAGWLDVYGLRHFGSRSDGWLWCFRLLGVQFLLAIAAYQAGVGFGPCVWLTVIRKGNLIIIKVQSQEM